MRPLAHEISVQELGTDHPATRIAAAMLPGAQHGEAPAFFRELVYPEYGWIPPRRTPMEIVKGFDPDATPYIG